jgi:hypothetical protein
MSEQELIEELAECFVVATEFLDSETIIKCLRAALSQDLEYHTKLVDTYRGIASAILES